MPPPDPISISFPPRRVVTVLGAGVLGLLLLHLGIAVGSAVTGHPLYYLPRFVDMGQEGNLPTFISALYLLGAAGLLGVAAAVVQRRGGRHIWAWTGLALGFALLSVDEAAQIHDELVGAILYAATDAEERTWHYLWYLPYIPLLIVLAAIYVPFLRSLPSRTLRLFLAAGTLYVGGAVGVEILEAYLVSQGASPVGLLLSKAVEETAELSGVVLLIYAVLSYLSGLGVRVSVRAGSEEPERLGGIAESQNVSDFTSYAEVSTRGSEASPRRP